LEWGARLAFHAGKGRSRTAIGAPQHRQGRAVGGMGAGASNEPMSSVRPVWKVRLSWKGRGRRLDKLRPARYEFLNRPVADHDRSFTCADS
jgi:hypothetical protein